MGRIATRHCYAAAAIAIAAIGVSASTQVKAGEVYVGVYKHDADFWRNAFSFIGTHPKNYEAGMDYELGWRSESIRSWSFLRHPRIYALAQVNDSHNTSHAAAGLAWKIPLSKSRKIYTVIGAGLALHDGRLHDFDPDEAGITAEERAARLARNAENRTPFSSRWLFNANLSLGYALSPRNALEASWDHISNGGLNGQVNLGQDNVGIRFSHRY